MTLNHKQMQRDEQVAQYFTRKWYSYDNYDHAIESASAQALATAQVSRGCRYI